MPDFASPAAVAARLADVGYLADEELAMAGFLSLRLHRPIFLEGDAGVGKTAFAAALAEAAGEEPEPDLYDRRFLLSRPLLRAIERAPCVLLVDEVDRAGDEFEAYPLELSRFAHGGSRCVRC
ncbi:hypothetical protein [Dactylosporangium sp. NPDC048998]|uniref:hypothetical protein n=1 Tax=Dactylosporangium sp. NPDC048998 TaxID=3363976 RepID=UPI0037151957